MKHRKILNVLKSIGYLFSTAVLAAVLGFLLQVVLARELGVEGFGTLASSLAIINLVGPIGGFGLAGVLLKLYGQEGSYANRWSSTVLIYLYITVSISIGLIIIWAYAGPHSGVNKILLLLLIPHLVSISLVPIVSAKFQLAGRVKHLSFLQLAPNALRLTPLVVLVYIFGFKADEVYYAAAIYTGSAIFLNVFLIYQLKNIFSGNFKAAIEINNDSDDQKSITPPLNELVLKAFPYGLAGFFYLIYFQSDLIILKYMKGEVEAGIYNVGFIIIAAVYIFPTVVYQKFLMPKLHVWQNVNRDKVRSVYYYGNIAMFSFGLIAVALIYLLMPTAMPIIFGEDYNSAISLVLFLSLAIPFRFIAASSGAILNTGEHIIAKVKLMSIIATLNIIINIILIPKYGIYGAAAATIFSEFLSMVLYSLYYRKKIKAV